MTKVFSILIITFSMLLFSCGENENKPKEHPKTEKHDNHDHATHNHAEGKEHTCSGNCTAGTHKCGDHCGCGDGCGCSTESSCSGECKVKS